MQSSHAIIIALASGILLTSCLPMRRRSEESRGQGGVSRDGGALVLTGVALQDGQGGTLLAAMVGKVPSFRVQQRRGQCPEINVRNTTSYVGSTNPSVYVDGTHATDTCILEILRANDVERVEVYPQGYTTRPGYGTHQHGLILVFMRSG